MHTLKETNEMKTKKNTFSLVSEVDVAESVCFFNAKLNIPVTIN